MAHGVHVQKNT